MKISIKVSILIVWFVAFLVVIFLSGQIKEAFIFIAGESFGGLLFSETILIIVVGMLFSVINVFLKSLPVSDVVVESTRLNGRRKVYQQLTLWCFVVGAVFLFLGFYYKNLPIPVVLFFELLSVFGTLLLPLSFLFGFITLSYLFKYRLLTHLSVNNNYVNNKLNENSIQEKKANLDTKSKIWLFISIPFVIIGVFCDVSIIGCFVNACNGGIGLLIILTIVAITNVAGAISISAFIIYRKRLNFKNF